MVIFRRIFFNRPSNINIRKNRARLFLGCTLADDDYPFPYHKSNVLFPAPNGIWLSGGVKFGFIFKA